MKLNSAQREMILNLAANLPEMLAAWNAGEDEPPSEPTEPELFTTIRRLPCDMKTEDGAFRYRQAPPHPGVTADRVAYFYEPAPPNGFPTVLVVITWRGPMPAEPQAFSPPPAPTGDA
jgi:hypothetical protein